MFVWQSSEILEKLVGSKERIGKVPRDEFAQQMDEDKAMDLTGDGDREKFDRLRTKHTSVNVCPGVLAEYGWSATRRLPWTTSINSWKGSSGHW